MYLPVEVVAVLLAAALLPSYHRNGRSAWQSGVNQANFTSIDVRKYEIKAFLLLLDHVALETQFEVPF